MFKVVKHKDGWGYALTYQGNNKPSWIIGDQFAWYRRKMDATERAKVLNTSGGAYV